MTLPPQLNVVGIAWFRREDYARARQLFEDGRKLPITFDKWLKRAQKAQQLQEAQGRLVERIYIDLDTFPAWCVTNGLNVDAHARTQFAAWQAGVKHRHRH